MPLNTQYDVLVLGLGGMGSAALYHLARRGLRVCGIEQHGEAHALGSSHGEVRVIRKGYYEHPDYVPLLHRAYELWDEVNATASDPVFKRCGMLVSAPPDSETITGLRDCFEQHGLAHERLTPTEAMRRYPQFRLPESDAVYYEPDAGYLFVERCVKAHLALARQHGAESRMNEKVLGWSSDEHGVTVRTASGALHAAKLVITMGPWVRELLASFGVAVDVLRKVQFWYEAPDSDGYRDPAFPIYFVEKDYGFFYGFPAIGDCGLKIAEHSGGTAVGNPDAVDRELHAVDETGILRCLAETFPALKPIRKRHSICMYTKTADSHFILDTHPEHANVAIGAGFSGHGFKFASVIGEILADLAQHGATQHPIGFLRMDRLRAAGKV